MNIKSRVCKINRKSCEKIIILSIFLFSISGCAPKTDYDSYEDKKEKGAKVFVKDRQVCQKLSSANARQIEGSKGAGERLNHKNSLFLLCMKNKDWAVRH